MGCRISFIAVCACSAGLAQTIVLSQRRTHGIRQRQQHHLACRRHFAGGQSALAWVAAINAANYLGQGNWQRPTTPVDDQNCGRTGPTGSKFGFGNGAFLTVQH